MPKPTRLRVALVDTSVATLFLADALSKMEHIDLTYIQQEGQGELRGRKTVIDSDVLNSALEILSPRIVGFLQDEKNVRPQLATKVMMMVFETQSTSSPCR